MSQTPIHEVPADSGERHAGVTLVDAHVHIHECFDLSRFFDHAYRNFADQAHRSGWPAAFDGVLMLTESAGVNQFSRLVESAASSATLPGDWRTSLTDEALLLAIAAEDGRHLFVLSGRQIVTSERLEVLALGLADDIEDGLPISDVIRRVQDGGAICVLPWGFGKWTGRRGRIIRELIETDLGSNLFLGDNAGRLGLWRAPDEFSQATRRGIGILPGTDPLPWPNQVVAPARFGSMLDARLPDAGRFAFIRQRLIADSARIQPYGNLERLLPFVKHQIGMQLRKHIG